MVELLVSRDDFSARVERYELSTGRYRGILGTPDLAFDFDQPGGIGVDASKRVYVAFRCHTCGADGGAGKAWILRFLPALGSLSQPFVFADGTATGFEGIAVDPSGGDVYAGQRQTGIVRRFDQHTGTPLGSSAPLSRPRGLTIDSGGRLYALAEAGGQGGANGQVLRSSPALDFQTLVGAGGPLGLDGGAAGMAVAPGGNELYVVDTSRDRVLRYRTSDGVFLGEFTTPGTDGCVDPVDLAFGPQGGNLFVSCNGSDSIVRYDVLSGRFLGEFASVSSPSYLAFVSYDLPPSLRLLSPPNGATAEPVSAFRWTPVTTPGASYRVTFATDPAMDGVVLQLPLNGEPKITTPQVALGFVKNNLIEGKTYFWRVTALDSSGNVTGESQEIFSVSYEIDQRGFTVISGLVRSNLNQAALAGATVSVSSSTGLAERTQSATVQTLFNGEYIVIAATRENGTPIGGTIEVRATKNGFVEESALIDQQQQTGASVSLDFTLTPVTGNTVRNDFDGDGDSDILWRHQVAGHILAWLMNGTTPAGASQIGRMGDTSWKVAGTGDFNGDGQVDILWRHQVTGHVVAWLLNGTTFAGAVQVGVLGNLQWRIVGTGDFNGDGRIDILWRHLGSGQMVAWLMNGTALQGVAQVGIILGNTDWRVAGVDDFNGDGRVDVLWHHRPTGQVVAWLLNGTAFASAASIGVSGDTQLRIAATGDYNRDGRPDILWRHQTSGQVRIWLMNGTTLAREVTAGTVADANWEIQP